MTVQLQRKSAAIDSSNAGPADTRNMEDASTAKKKLELDFEECTDQGCTDPIRKRRDFGPRGNAFRFSGEWNISNNNFEASACRAQAELSLDEESDLSKGIVIRCINHETGLPCKPLILMKFKGKGYVVFQYCAYIDGEIAGYYAGRYIPQSYSRRECIDIRAASVHVLCIRDTNSGDILVGDISHATPLSTYMSHGKIMSFAQSSYGDVKKSYGTLKIPSIYNE